MGKKDKDIFENIGNSEPEAESRQEEHIVVEQQVEIASEPEPPIKEVIQEPILKPIITTPLNVPIQPKKNPDKLRKIKNNPIKYY